jgi:integrase
MREIKARVVMTRDWIWFHLLAYTGMRRSEIRGLKWDDGDPAASVLRLETQTIRVIGKGRKPRLVPVHPALGEVLVHHRAEPGRYVVPSDGKNGVAMETIIDMSRRLHPTYTPHDYRRTVATSLRRNGVDSGVIDRIMGWAPSSIFRRYYDNVADAELHRAILKLYADDPV